MLEVLRSLHLKLGQFGFLLSPWGAFNEAENMKLRAQESMKPVLGQL